MNARLRTWSQLEYLDPESSLRALRALELGLTDASIPERIRRLRTNALKRDRETRDALLFAYGMSAVVGARVYVAPGETEDCDFITATVVDDTVSYTCVQLKELVPQDLNPTQTLSELLDQLSKRPQSDASLAVRLNRRGTIPLADLAAARAPFAEIWFFWAGDPASSSWYLFGDVLGSPSLYSFAYPEPNGPPAAISPGAG